MRQGHVFRWIEASDGASHDPWKQVGIIVTADCDLAQGKHGAFLSYVPLLRATDYLRLFVLPQILEKSLRPKVDELHAKLAMIQQALQPAHPQPISPEVLRSWLTELGTSAVLTELGMPQGAQRDRASELFSLVEHAWLALKTSTFDSLFAAAVAVRGGTETHAQKVRDQLREKLRSLPGDAFYLTSLPEIDDFGFIAYLRLVREISASAIAIRYTDTRRSDVKAIRFAKLTAPYLYRLTQQLGEVFSSIGLPTEYEAERDASSELLLSRHGAPQ